MRRKIYDRLLKWKNESRGRTAILIDGARRTGKSYIAEAFAKNEYRSYILLDFNKIGNRYESLFNDYLDQLDLFFMYLSNNTGVKLYPRESLIIFDEVQEFPRARAAIKYLVADGRYDYMETGSLISIHRNVRNIVIPSEEEHLKMHPMDFEEFLWAMGNEMLMDFVRDRFAGKEPMGQLMHRRAMDYFRQYLIVGGMPQAVQTYVETKDFDEVDRVKRSILTLYRADISKYATGQEMNVIGIFEELPSQLQRHEKRFKLSSLKKDARFRDYSTAFFWLEDAMIINICYGATEPSIGLRLKREHLALKCYMADTGLLISHAFDENGITSGELYRKLLSDKLEANKGMIVENIVAQMLTASEHKLYFYSEPNRTDAGSRMEIDFLIAKSKITSRHNISPIEVKSSPNYTLASIRKFMKKYHEQLNVPYVIHTSDYKEADGITFYPIYMTPLL